jgi:hypothetical protein
MKRSKLAKRAKSHSAGWWQRESDDLMQTINRLSGGACESCGGKNEVLHHYITKALSSFLRYRWENGIKLCFKCHFNHHIRNDPAIMERVERKRGTGWVDWIEEHRRLPQQTGVKYYQQIHAEFSKLLEELKKQ